MTPLVFSLEVDKYPAFRARVYMNDYLVSEFFVDYADASEEDAVKIFASRLMERLR